MLKIFRSAPRPGSQNLDNQALPEENGWERDNQVEGQLAIDVYQTIDKIIIKAAIAGVKSEDLKISLHHDLLTIRGVRHLPESVADEDYLFRECYWGNFSRAIILPSEVEPKKIDAILDNGILTISLEKVKTEPINIVVQDDDNQENSDQEEE